MNQLITPSQWLGQFLKDRGLRQPTGKPLYEYQATEAEYTLLKELVFKHKDSKLHGYNNISWAAIFCLYCSVWYQRNYESNDGWSWHAIWVDLGDELTPSQIEKTVLKGIESYWLRPIKTYTERRNFLGTLFSEGGLPFKLLSNNDNKFGQVLKRILKNVAVAKLLGEPIEKLVAINVQSLPQAFNEQESIQLITLMTEKLVNLVDIFALENKSNPADYLDNVSPKWREDFPIPLDNSIGTNIVNSWLLQASHEGFKRTKFNKKLLTEHYLNINELTITTKLLLPDELIMKTQPHQLKSNRLELFLAESTQDLQNLGVSYINGTGESALIKVRNRSIRVLRKSSETQLSVVARQGGNEIARWLLDNTSVFLNEMPVGFIKQDGEYKYAGQATFSHKEELYLILPKSSNYNIINGEVSSWPQNIHSSKPNFILLQGEIVITLDDDKYRVKSLNTSTPELGLNLFGDMITYDTEPSATYLGLPKYRFIDSDLSLDHVLTEYISGQPKSELMLHELYGRQTFALKNQHGETLFRKRIGLLPPGVKISTKAGIQIGQGEINITTKNKMIYSISTDRVTFIKKDTPDGVCLQLSCDGLPPSELTLSITPNLMATPIHIKLPYPRQGAFVFDAIGEPLKKHLSIDDLLGSRLHLFASAECSANFEIDIVLENQGRSPPYFKHQFRVGEQPTIISLHSFKDEINELLSLAPDLDAQVTMTISSFSGNLKYKIYRYSSRIYETEDKRFFKISAEGQNVVAGAELLLMQMSNPERTPTKIEALISEGISTGHYEMPQVDKNEGPWLIVPSSNSATNFRAKLLVGHDSSNHMSEDEADHDQVKQQVNSLQRAVQAYHPKFNTHVIADVVMQMADNLQHSGWEFLVKLFSNYQNLSLTTFQVWREIVANPKALILCFYRFEANPQFMARIESEFPVLWQVTPPELFIQTYKQVLDWLEQKGVDKQYVKMIAEPWYESILYHIPGFSEELVSYLITNKIDPKLKLPLPIMNIAGQDWLQDLLREHSENDVWPDSEGYELSKWYQNNSLGQIDINSLHNFQNSVIYLPVFLAAVSTGKANLSDIYDSSSNAIFKLKKVRDFDPNWFASMYTFHLLTFSELI
ncbi:STY4851/ECs_5259 family protein [Shewanella baltica]|uniref:STY4851/ECs_5259 family protein n=1 Tax=Shewanella TaxID=22 RepID=UPI0024B95A74|nr:STY4851/ECs_5259 family protein [Shewanella baltica]